MADIIRALTEAIDKIGLMAVLIICVVAAAAYIVRWNRALVDRLVEVNNTISNLSNQTISRNTVAANANTESNLKLESSIKTLCDAFGSDPTKVCKLMDTLKHAGFDEKTIMSVARKYAQKNDIPIET